VLKLFYSAAVYMVLGVASGLYYRELTKLTDFPAGQSSQLGEVHGHLLTLGFVAFLLVLVLEKLFVLSRSPLFTWFFWVYNAGLVLTVGMMIWHGTSTVLGGSFGAALSGIAGLGHITIATGLALLFVALGQRITAEVRDRNGSAVNTASVTTNRAG